jgi:membrane-associated protease RseP (regulator of RpoE activity)
MGTDYNQYYQSSQGGEPVMFEEPRKRFKLGVYLNIFLFIATFFTTTLAGTGWLNLDPYDLSNFRFGLTYSVLILTVLSCHEFGHYFAAKIHKVKVTLPYFIPFPLFLNPFGTMGAVIRMQSPSRTRKALFDIGIAGPVSGFIVSLIILIYGMTHLPSIEYLFHIHPEYRSSGISLSGFSFGNTLLYWGLGKILTSSPDVFLPPMNEMYHYPFLCVGWFGLLITALNLLPVGQLDGGHIVYALFGNKHKVIARVFFGLTLSVGLAGFLPFAGINIFANYGLFNWLVWAFVIYFVIRVDHPPIYDPEPLDLKRKIWGAFALFMFLTSFTPAPFNNF